MKPFEVTLTDIDDDDRYRSTMRIVHQGKVIQEETDGGEPEDNSFTRDWSWVPAAIEKAYALGVEDTHRAAATASEGAKAPEQSGTGEP